MENTDTRKMDSQDNLNNKPNYIAILGSSSDFLVIFKKTEKLASAVYLITSLFSDSEPMKWTLRKKVSDLLSYILTYKSIRQSEFPSYVLNVKTKVHEVVSLMDVCVLGGLLSTMNFSIVEKEFSNLISLISNYKHESDSSNGIIPVSFFDTAKFQQFTPSFETSTLKDSVFIKDTNAFKSNNRQNIILNLLKKRKDLSIKDISAVIRDVSEKTIQRELVSLIDAGVISKVGERRWSKYSINTAK